MIRLLGFLTLCGAAVYHMAARGILLLFLTLCFLLIAFYGDE